MSVGLAAVAVLFPISAFALESGKITIEGVYENVQTDMKDYNANNLNSAAGNLQTQRGLLKITDKGFASGAYLSLIGGISFSGKFNGGSVTNNGASTNSQTLNFDQSSPTFGAEIGIDLLGSSSMFHLIPSLSWMHTSFSGTSESFGPNGLSLAGANSAAITSVASNYTETNFQARLTLAIDLAGGGGGQNYSTGPSSGFTIYGGAMENVDSLQGTTVYNGGPTFEQYSFSTARPEGVFAGAILNLGGLAINGEIQAISTTTYRGSLSYSF